MESEWATAAGLRISLEEGSEAIFVSDHSLCADRAFCALKYFLIYLGLLIFLSWKGHRDSSVCFDVVV